MPAIAENRYSPHAFPYMVSMIDGMQPKHDFLLMKNPQWSRKIENGGKGTILRTPEEHFHVDFVENTRCIRTKSA